MSTLRIVLVDDHPIVRSGSRQLLALEPGWQVIAEVGSAPDPAASMLHSTCDVLMLYISLPSGAGLAILRPLMAIRQNMTLLVMSMSPAELYVPPPMPNGVGDLVP